MQCAHGRCRRRVALSSHTSRDVGSDRLRLISRATPSVAALVGLLKPGMTLRVVGCPEGGGGALMAMSDALCTAMN